MFTTIKNFEEIDKGSFGKLRHADGGDVSLYDRL